MSKINLQPTFTRWAFFVTYEKDFQGTFPLAQD